MKDEDKADQRGKAVAGSGKNPETFISGTFPWHVTCENGEWGVVGEGRLTKIWRPASQLRTSRSLDFIVRGWGATEKLATGKALIPFPC